jgi:hypothetical protein
MEAAAGFRSLAVPLQADHAATVRPALLLTQAGALTIDCHGRECVNRREPGADVAGVRQVGASRPGRAFRQHTRASPHLRIGRRRERAGNSHPRPSKSVATRNRGEWI